ncbi:DNA processing protein DprA [Spirochaetia bacterium]|nr:DNA processing protein DprA [Spirochaetia bacterium]
MTNRGLTDLLISRIPGISSVDRILLCKRFDREEDIWGLSKTDVEELTGRRIFHAWNMDKVRAKAERDAMLAGRRGIAYISYTDETYPPQLREIYDPPAVLFYRGMLPDLFCPLAAVVGTRKPSSGALAQCYRISRELGEAGIPVVSGLALGIDAMAHRGNIDGGGPTLAVLGSGLDGIYPSSNRGLARQILERGGVLLSEYPPESLPFKGHFPARNRIISGLARGVLIVEAPEKSGARITAGLALEHNRDVWIASAGMAAMGNRILHEEGARVISSAEEILDEWGIIREEKPGDLIPFSGGHLASSLARELNIDCAGEGSWQ